MAKVTKTCVTCGKPFSVWPNRAETAKTCSQPCRGKLIARQYAEQRVQKTCPVCKTVFAVYKARGDTAVCCSLSCANKLPSRKRSTGENHYTWKGGQSEHAEGYLYVRAEGHPYSGNAGYVFEHRLVMESRMRKEAPEHRFLIEHDGVLYLRPEIQVHHINETKRDNASGNLLACTAGAHRSIHSGKPPMAGEAWPEVEGLLQFKPYKVTCTCQRCGVEFLKKRCDVERGSGKYCSRACYVNPVAK